MQNKLYLHIPSFEELTYRQTILSQPRTMDYNRGYDLGISAYDPSTGCIDFPCRDWQPWYEYWIGNEPERYYAYIARKEDRAFIGEVNLHYSASTGWYDMGIVIEAAFRGSGYAREALQLLLHQAFCAFCAAAVHNDFERTRTAALHTHLSAGFEVLRESGEISDLLITRERYIADHAKK